MNEFTLAALQSFPQQLEELFRMVPAGHAHWTPVSWDGIPSERLNPIEQICHVRDIEVDGYHVRFQRMLEETNSVLASVDGYALITERNYRDAQPDDVFAAIRVHVARRLKCWRN